VRDEGRTTIHRASHLQSNHRAASILLLCEPFMTVSRICQQRPDQNLLATTKIQTTGDLFPEQQTG
jgi:hypothetical protein